MEKTDNPPGERKLVAEWSDTIDSLLLSCIQECGHWGWDKVDVGIEKNFGSLRLEISGWAKVDYDFIEAEFQGNHDCPPDPNEYRLNYIDFSGDILLWDEAEEKVILIANKWNYYER